MKNPKNAGSLTGANKTSNRQTRINKKGDSDTDQMGRASICYHGIQRKGPKGKAPKKGPKKGAQRKGTIFIDGYPSMNINDGCPSMDFQFFEIQFFEKTMKKL